MRGIVGCEFSQVITKAFRDRGHEFYSCDLKPTTGNKDWHFQEDIFIVLAREFFDVGIFHPPCTHLAVSGAKHFVQKRLDGRQQEAIDFFMRFTNLKNIRRTCIENPVGIMSTIYRKPTQIVQPWHYGDPFTKTTCLWLKGLPRLNATFKDMDLFDIPKAVKGADRGGRHITKSGKSMPDWYNLPPSDDRGEIRSITFPGMAAAIADQWGILT